jgi:parallel beta-helix repeat protein
LKKIHAIVLVGLIIINGAIGFSIGATQVENVTTSAFIAVESNPVLINEMVIVNLHIEPSPPKSTDFVRGLTLILTRPDGVSYFLGPFMAYPNGSTVKAPFEPTQLGTYTLQLNYSGQFFESANVSYAPSQSPKITLSVVQSLLAPTPAPTPYPILTPQPPLSLPKVADSKIITVPDNFQTITAAIGNSTNGDTIYVKSGTYSEPLLVINRTISIIGQNSENTVINNIDQNAIIEWLGGYPMPFGQTIGLRITAPNVRISGFTIKSASTGIDILGNGSQIVGNIIEGFDFVDGYEIGINVTGSGTQIVGNIIKGATFGVLAKGTHQNIQENVFESIYTALSLSCDHSRISGNIIFGIGTCGMLVTGDSNLIEKNNLSDQLDGISISSSGNIVLKNRIENNGKGDGLMISRSWIARDLWGNNLVCGNTFSQYEYGIIIMGSQNNSIFANSLIKNEIGISVLRNQSWLSNQTDRQSWQTSYDNIFYHNNFVDNCVRQANDWSWEGVNSWDNGKEGNYWGSFIGKDGNHDGISDDSFAINSAYLINIGNFYKNQLQDPRVINPNSASDHYPLMAPYDISSLTLQLPEWAITMLNLTDSPVVAPTPSPNQTFPSSQTPSSSSYSSIPEFPSWIILPALVIAMLIFAAIKRRINLGKF